MKKLILLSILVAASSVFGVDFRSPSFLSVPFVQITNTVGLTNLASISCVGGSNVTGVIYTNNSKTRVVVAAGSAPSTYNLCVPYIPLGKTDTMIPIYTNSAAAITGARLAGPHTRGIYIRLVGGANANQAQSFIFARVPSDSGVDSTAAADKFTISVTPSGATQVQSYTPVDDWYLVGCKGLTLVSVTGAADNEASTQVQILECSLCGYW